MRFLQQNIILSSVRQLNKLLPRHYKVQGLWVYLSLILSSFLELFGLATLIPLFMVILEDNALGNHAWLKAVYDFLGFEQEQSFILFLCVFIISAIIIKNVVNLAIKYFQGHFAFGLYTYFASQLLQQAYRNGYVYIKSQNSNQLARDINEAAFRLGRNLVLPLLSFLNELFVLTLILVGIMLYDPKVVLLLLIVVMPGFLLFYQATKRKIQALNLKHHEIKADLLQDLYQAIFGYADVVLNHRQAYFFDRYAADTHKNRRLQTWLNVFTHAPTRVIETAMMLGILCIILYGLFYLNDKAELTLLLGVFALAAYRILPSINRSLAALLQVSGNAFTLDIVKDIEPGSQAPPLPEPLSFDQEIQVDSLSFQYPQRPQKVLDRVSFSVKKGEKIGIVGKSGSGKSTLANILLGFLPPSEGQVLIDGVPLEAQTLGSWRRLVGYVQQEIYLVDGTLAENIAFGYNHFDEARLREVVQQASLSELVAELPQGLHTPIGERGSQISGGQRQRIGIARALYAGAKVLFFDEATSALDQETEQEITEAIGQLARKNLTMFIIAHRITTLKYCDRIIELELGKIVKEHHYEELLQTHL